jgi:hypothetical protein
MEHFQGPGLFKMVLVTLVFHAVLVLGTSVSFLKTSLMGEDVSKLTKEQRVEKAVADATASLRKIAAVNGLNPQDISDKFSGGASRVAKKVTLPGGAQPPAETNPAPEATTAPVVIPAPASTNPPKPESQIEKDLKKTVDGPKAPPATVTDDIF